ncbi:HD domain-containing protein [bacterium]|nr:HD domain-containing protein [bacterium]
MSYRGLSGNGVCGDCDQVSAVLKLIARTRKLPVMPELALGILDVYGRLDGVREAAVFLDPQVAATLDPGCGRRSQYLAVLGPGQGEPAWISAPSAWRRRAFAVLGQDGAGIPAEGRGPWGEALPWPSATWSDQDAWLGLNLDLHGDPALGLLLVIGAAEWPAAGNPARSRLVQLKDVMEPVLAIWSEASSLRSRLRQAATETRALSRINQLQGRFVAMATHEFKTPLTSITAYADVLMGQITDEQFPHATEFLDVIRTEAGRLLRMVNRILDFSRLEYGSNLLDMRLLDLEPMVRETVRSLHPAIQEKHQSVTVAAPRRLPRVEGDADLIRQVLVNLIGNAVKYTPDRGRIAVDLAELEAAVSVKVLDDGPGIDPQDMKRIFREFFRAGGAAGKQDGTGLGLAIARHIVNIHGGTISVQPRTGGGSDFTFLLPKAADVWAPLPGYLAKGNDPAGARMLLVHLMRLLAELSGSRASVLLVRDGEGGLLPVCGMGLDPGLPEPAAFTEDRAWSGFLETGLMLQAGPETRGLLQSLPGLAEDLDRGGDWVVAPVARQNKVLGAVLLGKRRRPGSLDAADAEQIQVLVDLAHTVLSRMDHEPAKLAEAMRALIQTRRGGIPTATAGSLQLVRRLARRLGVSRRNLASLQIAAALHDVGMARVEEDIRLGEGRLSWDEKDAVDGHVDIGLDLMRPLIPDHAVETIIRHHHERVDGNGYPEGLRGEAIPLGSRILAVVDAWFSLTTDRPYRRALVPGEALQEIRSHAGAQFDPAVVEAFVALMEGAEDLAAGARSGTGPDPQDKEQP